MVKKITTLDLIYGSPQSFYRDFCPLCGARFFGDSPEEVLNLIVKHNDDGTCEKNWRSWDVALNDTGEDLK